jgi:lipopolysaccharide export LptBFGC system permease protein LptF
MSPRARVGLAFGVDLAATLLFVSVGRSSHQGDPGLPGLLVTWWPFAIALILGWLGTVAWKRPFGILWPGAGIALVTVAGGMLLRAASGQGTAVPFLIVATLSLLLLLVGWRAAVGLWRRSRRRTAPAERPRTTERYP